MHACIWPSPEISCHRASIYVYPNRFRVSSLRNVTPQNVHCARAFIKFAIQTYPTVCWCLASPAHRLPFTYEIIHTLHASMFQFRPASPPSTLSLSIHYVQIVTISFVSVGSFVRVLYWHSVGNPVCFILCAIFVRLEIFNSEIDLSSIHFSNPLYNRFTFKHTHTHTSMARRRRRTTTQN